MREPRTVSASVTAPTLPEPGAQPGGEALEPLRERTWPPPLPRRLWPFEAEYVALAAELASDLGGIENMTAARRALAAATLEVHVIRRKLGRNLLARGIVRRNGELRAALVSYFTAANTERLNWLALGLERRARDLTPDLRAAWKREGVTPEAARGGNGAVSSPDPSPDVDRSTDAAPGGGPGATEGLPGGSSKRPAKQQQEHGLGRRGAGCSGVEPDV